MEVVRRGVWEKGLDFEIALEEAFQEFTVYWGEVEAPAVGSGANKNFNRMWQAVEFYFDEYPLHSDPIRPYILDEKTGKTGIEYSFGVPLPINNPDTGDPIIYAGRTDLLGYYNKLAAIIDEKTTSQLGASWAEKWKLRGQFMGYVWAARQYGIDVQIVIVRGVSILKTKFGTLEVPLQFTPHIIERWHTNMLIKVSQMSEAYTQIKENSDWLNAEYYFPMSFGSTCSDFGGCMFTDVCLSKTPHMWYSDFARRDWNPLDKNPAIENTK